MTGPTPLHRELADLLAHGRDRTLALIEPLDDEEIHAQPVDFLSPLVWDVGHIGCFEDLWLVRGLSGRGSRDPDRDHLYDAFENPRAVRGDLPLMPRADAVRHLADVRDETLTLLRGLELAPDAPLLADGYVHRMIAQHESQHQETMLQALDLREDVPYRGTSPSPATHRRVVDDDRLVVPGGPCLIGTDDRTWAHDNERPRHRREVSTFAIDRHPVTCRRYAQFVDAGGYDDPRWWSLRGWAWRTETGHTAPQGWRRAADGEWHVIRFGWAQPLDPNEPVQHVSGFEAEAFAAFAGGRLPTEFEWEKAALWDPATGRHRRFPWGDTPPDTRHANLGGRRFGPAPVGTLPAGASAYGVEHLAGDVYEWTSSPFEGYPGYSSFPYPEYSEVFFGGDYRVLRGASWAIDGPLARGTYRNWDHPYRRQIFAGIRVAYDVRP